MDTHGGLDPNTHGVSNACISTQFLLDTPGDSKSWRPVIQDSSFHLDVSIVICFCCWLNPEGTEGNTEHAKPDSTVPYLISLNLAIVGNIKSFYPLYHNVTAVPKTAYSTNC